MATDKRITELPAATTPLAGTEKVEILQGGVNKQVDASELGGGVGNFVPLTLTADTTIDGQGNELILQGGAAEAVKLALDGVNNTQHALIYKTGGVVRWQVHTDNNETGSANVGSDFHIERFDDAGAYLDTPIIIDRTDGVVDFDKSPTAPTAAVGTNTTQVATTAFVQAATSVNVGNLLYLYNNFI